MICKYCETEYGMSHTPYQCSAIVVKQRDKAREQVRILREAIELLQEYPFHIMAACNPLNPNCICGYDLARLAAIEALAATAPDEGSE